MGRRYECRVCSLFPILVPSTASVGGRISPAYTPYTTPGRGSVGGSFLCLPWPAGAASHLSPTKTARVQGRYAPPSEEAKSGYSQTAIPPSGCGATRLLKDSSSPLLTPAPPLLFFVVPSRPTLSAYGCNSRGAASAFFNFNVRRVGSRGPPRRSLTREELLPVVAANLIVHSLHAIF